MNKSLIMLKIVNENGEKIKSLTSRKIKRIYWFIEAGKNKDCLYKLSVKYGGGYKNEGEYGNKKDLICALKSFTEPD